MPVFGGNPIPPVLKEHINNGTLVGNNLANLIGSQRGSLILFSYPMPLNTDIMWHDFPMVLLDKVYPRKNRRKGDREGIISFSGYNLQYMPAELRITLFNDLYAKWREGGTHSFDEWKKDLRFRPNAMLDNRALNFGTLMVEYFNNNTMATSMMARDAIGAYRNYRMSRVDGPIYRAVNTDDQKGILDIVPLDVGKWRYRYTGRKTNKNLHRVTGKVSR
tara:strand:+ start:240 stop:896 length:657 start_codon:yes stop_codon:yes gene_type:complete